MHPATFRAGLRRLAMACGLLTAAAAAGPSAQPQEAPPSPVRYTEAKEYPVRRTIQLPGSTESRTASLVASEVEGIVARVHVREGDTVRTGEPLAQLRTTSLELRLRSTQSQLQEAESRLKLAELSLARVKGLFEQEVASVQEFDTATYDVAAWQGRVGSLRAELGRLELAVSLSTIRAPFAGLVAQKRTEVGSWVAAGGPVVEMLSLDEIEVRVDVPERYFSGLNPGAQAQVTFDSLPGLKITGRVSAIVPRADPSARTFPLKVKVSNREGRIGVGMLAQVSFPAGEAYRATVVPKDAVVTQGAEKFVYLINGDDTISRVAVQPGDAVGPWVVVQGEVRPGQKVITRGNERLMPGARVKGEPLEYALP